MGSPLTNRRAFSRVPWMTQKTGSARTEQRRARRNPHDGGRPAGIRRPNAGSRTRRVVSDPLGRTDWLVGGMIADAVESDRHAGLQGIPSGWSVDRMILHGTCLIGQNGEMLSAGSAVVFRDAALSDVWAVVDLVQSAYRGEASRDGWTTEADLLDGNRIDPDTVREVLSAPRSKIMLAYQKLPSRQTMSANHCDMEPGAVDELSACCQLADEGENTGYFGLFAVRPKRQGTGIGRAVLVEAERRAVTDWRSARCACS